MDELRIGDAERDDALRKLGEHLAAGRLDMDEHDERSSKVIAARTRRDISNVFADLPAPQPTFGDSLPAARDRTVATGQATPADSAPAAQKGKGAAVRTFATGLCGLVWAACIAIMVMGNVGWWVILVPIAYSAVLGAWAQASGDPPRAARRELRHRHGRGGRRHHDWQYGGPRYEVGGREATGRELNEGEGRAE